MEEDNNNKRLLVAAGLCFAVLMAYQVFFPTPVQKHQPTAGNGTATATSAVAMGTETATTTAVAVAPSATNVEPKTFEFRGEVPGEKENKPIPFYVRLSNVGGVIEVFELPSYKERDKDNRKTEFGIALAVPSKDVFGEMGSIRFVDGTTFTMPEKPIYEIAEQTDKSIKYRYTSPQGIEVEREYLLYPDSFQMELAVTVRNRSAQPQSHRLEIGAAMTTTDTMVTSGGGFLSNFIAPPDHLTALCNSNGSVEREQFQSLEKDGAKTYKESVRWAAMDRQYFLAAIVPRAETDVECVLGTKDKAARAALQLGVVSLPPGDSKRHKFTAYLGVKKPAMLTLVDAELESAIDYNVLGMNLAVVCAGLLWILGMFHQLFNSWGLAIIGLTVLVKGMLFPLNQRSGRSMRAMTALKPQLDGIREKFPDDRQRQSEEMMKLYKEHNVNPAGGCLPVLIQMPIWFSLYRSLAVSVDLYQQSFLWIPDLTARDPLWILPVLLVVVMFLQQKMTPTTMDPAQQKIMQYTMPLMFGAMMMALPAGLCFYILVNTLLTILQQHLINRSIGPLGGSASSVQGATA